MLKQWPTLYVKERSSVIRESVPCRTSAACTRESLVHTLAKVSTYITTTKYSEKLYNFKLTIKFNFIL